MITINNKTYNLPNFPYFKSGKHQYELKIVPMYLACLDCEGPKTYKELQKLSKSRNYTGQQTNTLDYLRRYEFVEVIENRPMKLKITDLGKVYLKQIGM